MCRRRACAECCCGTLVCPTQLTSARAVLYVHFWPESHNTTADIAQRVVCKDTATRVRRITVQVTGGTPLTGVKMIAAVVFCGDASIYSGSHNLHPLDWDFTDDW